MSIQNLTGQTLGQYELRELLGAGGMGAVYRGYQSSLKRYVAVKVLAANLAEQPGALERFNREAQTSAALEHTNIIRIYDYGTQRGISYLVMHLLTGGSLAERITQRAGTDKPLPSLGEVAGLLKQLAGALDYAHSQGVIHRDIKPSNVMFDNHGNAYLVDFGIAKLVQATSGLTASGMVVGTWGYMAPEQWKAETLTSATDQYALAVMTYALVTGQMPFDAPTPAGIMHRHLNEKPTPVHTRRPDVPEAVTEVIERALSKKQEDRFPTATAFAQAFDRSIRGQTGEMTGFFTTAVPRRGLPQPSAVLMPSQPVTAARPIYQHPAMWAMAALVLVLVAVVALLLLGGEDKNESQAGTTPAALAASPTMEGESQMTRFVVPTTAPAIMIQPSDTLPPTSTLTPAPTETPSPTQTPSLTETPSATPSPTLTLSPVPTETPDLPATANALLVGHLTETAESWTDTPVPTATPTPDLLATAEAMAIAGMTATADAWTDTPTFTPLPPTPEPTAEPTEEPTEEPVAEATEEVAAPGDLTRDLIDCTRYDLSGLRIGLVTDVGRINDQSFNQSSWEGVLAAEKCGARVDYIETQDAADYASNIAVFTENGYNIVVTVGYALGVATSEAAAIHPDVLFIGVDQFQSEVTPNVVALVFHEDQSGFLAGVLAARLTRTNVIAAVLGTDIVPPVVAFKEGYEAGALYANPDVSIISTYHPGAINQAFTDPEWGAATAQWSLEWGADVVFGAGGKTGNGALIEVANAVGAGGPPPYCIGVDTDQWLTVPEAHPCLVSSAVKLLDVGIADIIKATVDGNFEPGNFYGQAALAPFHDFEGFIPADVKAELADIAGRLVDGSLSTGYGVAAEPEATQEPAPATAVPHLGMVTVGTNAEYMPFEYVDENGNIVGFDIDLMEAIAGYGGFEVQWVNTRWDGIFVALASGEFDAVCSAATITSEREEIVDFTHPYFNAGQMIAVRQADADVIRVPSDLAGLRVGVQAGTTGDIVASEIAGVEVVRYDEITLAFQALAWGDVDAIVNDGPVNADIINANPDLGVVQVGDPFTDEFYGIAVRPDRPDLLNATNTGLSEVIANGTYRKIFLKWFGSDPPSMFMP